MNESFAVSTADFRRWTTDEWNAACRSLNPYYGIKVDDGHVAYECHCDRPHCMFCDGGLFACDVCGSFEGATTTFCPGRAMTKTEADAVYTGDLDYRDGDWIQAPSTQTPAIHAHARQVLISTCGCGRLSALGASEPCDTCGQVPV